MRNPNDTRPTFIYVLKDPRNNKVRYVGQTTRPLKKRLRQHIAEKSSTYKCNWIQSLRRDGVKPIIALIQEVPYYDDWRVWEAFWIKLYRDLGYRLVNATDGGEGATGYIPSIEAIEKTRRANMRPIAQYTYEGKFIGKWDSASTAGEKLGISRSAITACVNKRIKSSGGFLWRYWKDTLGADIEPIIHGGESGCRRKPVARYTRKGKFMDKWESAVEVSRVLGIAPSSICVCVNSSSKTGHKTAGGYQWRYWSETLGADIEPIAY
jgi:hypothetical protein